MRPSSIFFSRTLCTLCCLFGALFTICGNSVNANTILENLSGETLLKASPKVFHKTIEFSQAGEYQIDLSRLDPFPGTGSIAKAVLVKGIRALASLDLNLGDEVTDRANATFFLSEEEVGAYELYIYNSPNQTGIGTLGLEIQCPEGTQDEPACVEEVFLVNEIPKTEETSFDEVIDFEITEPQVLVFKALDYGLESEGISPFDILSLVLVDLDAEFGTPAVFKIDSFENKSIDVIVGEVLPSKYRLFMSGNHDETQFAQVGWSLESTTSGIINSGVAQFQPENLTDQNISGVQLIQEIALNAGSYQLGLNAKYFQDFVADYSVLLAKADNPVESIQLTLSEAISSSVALTGGDYLLYLLGADVETEGGVLQVSLLDSANGNAEVFKRLVPVGGAESLGGFISSEEETLGFSIKDMNFGSGNIPVVFMLVDKNNLDNSFQFGTEFLSFERNLSASDYELFVLNLTADETESGVLYFSIIDSLGLSVLDGYFRVGDVFLGNLNLLVLPSEFRLFLKDHDLPETSQLVKLALFRQGEVPFQTTLSGFDNLYESELISLVEGNDYVVAYQIVTGEAGNALFGYQIEIPNTEIVGGVVDIDRAVEGEGGGSSGGAFSVLTLFFLGFAIVIRRNKLGRI